MTQHTPAAVASTYFDALSRGDVPTAIAQLSPTVTWHQPGRNPFSGDHLGLDGCGVHLGRDGVDGAVDSDDEIDDGQSVSCRCGSASPAGTGNDGHGRQDLLTVRAAIVEVHLFAEDVDAGDSYLEMTRRQGSNPVTPRVTPASRTDSHTIGLRGIFTSNVGRLGRYGSGEHSDCTHRGLVFRESPGRRLHPSGLWPLTRKRRIVRVP